MMVLSFFILKFFTDCKFDRCIFSADAINAIYKTILICKYYLTAFGIVARTNYFDYTFTIHIQVKQFRR